MRTRPPARVSETSEAASLARVMFPPAAATALPPVLNWNWAPPNYNCPKHGGHPDWLQFFWSQRAGISPLLCLRCFAQHLEAAIPGVVATDDSTPSANLPVWPPP